jgi:hypothetical protein
MSHVPVPFFLADLGLRNNFSDFAGGRTRTRTLDPLIKSQLLYQLSYAPCASCAGRVV